MKINKDFLRDLKCLKLFLTIPTNATGTQYRSYIVKGVFDVYGA